MNTIIVPTDFSPAAQQATAYAAQLARQTAATVLLLHVFQLPVHMTEYPVMVVPADDLKKSVDEGLQRAVKEAQKTADDISFQTESRMGDVATEIEEACKEKAPFAVVVGAKDLTGFERFLFGDTTSSLIKNCSYPVIAVPEGAKIDTPRNIVLATDLLNTDELPLANIAAITQVLGASLHVVHVEQDDNKHSPDGLMAAFTDVNATYHAINEEDVAEGLKKFVEQNGVDLLVVLPHKHSLYERLFFKGHTQGILNAVHVPVMSLRNDRQ
jgi:nucleotide-binding universal stress UspA family protein